MNTVIVGAGAFGTALAIALAGVGRVTLLGRDPHLMQTLRDTRENASRLPGAHLPAGVEVSHDAACLADAETVLLCVPMQRMGDWLKNHSAYLTDQALIACCKGIDLDSLSGPTSVISHHAPNAEPAVLTGPSFADDIARGLPTALTLACVNETRLRALQQALTRPNLRLYRSKDVIGAELGGALKNVIAIAAGCGIGAGLGESARAALITRGFAEMQRLSLHLGAQPETLMGLSGLGDLTLTCSSEQSRNFRFGLSIGQSQPFDPAVTVEGAATAQAAMRIADDQGLDLPITQAVCDLVTGASSIETAMKTLLSRPLKAE